MTYIKLEDAVKAVEAHYNEMWHCRQIHHAEGNEDSVGRLDARCRTASQIAQALRSLPTDDGWEELDEWCAKQAKSIMEVYHPLIMQGGFNLNCPAYRKSLGEHYAFMRMRSYIKGARKAALGPLPAPPAC